MTQNDLMVQGPGKPTVASNVLVRVKTSKSTQPMAQISDLKLYFAPWHNSGDM